MRKFLTAAIVLASATFSFAADTYKVDAVHSGVTFVAHHAGAGFTPGRFNEVSGTFTIDGAASTFTISIPVDSVDTNNDKRDAHLKSPDWFNAKQYAAIEFKSTKVEAVDDTTLKVTGDLTLHGATRAISFDLKLTGQGEFPAGTKRQGVRAQFPVKMSEYGIKGMPGAVDDTITLDVMLEGTK